MPSAKRTQSEIRRGVRTEIVFVEYIYLQVEYDFTSSTHKTRLNENDLKPIGKMN